MQTSQFKLNVLTLMVLAFIAFVVGVTMFTVVGISTIVMGNSAQALEGWFTAYMGIALCIIVGTNAIFIGPDMADEPIGSPERRDSERFLMLVKVLLFISTPGFAWYLRDEEKALYIVLILIIMGLIAWLLKSGVLAAVISMIFRRVGWILHFAVMLPFFLLEAVYFTAVAGIIIGLQTWVIYTIATLIYQFSGFSAEVLPFVSGIAPFILFLWCTYGASRNRKYNMLGGYFAQIQWVTIRIIVPISDFFDFITRFFDFVGNFAKSGINKVTEWLSIPFKALQGFVHKTFKLGLIVS